MNEYKRKCFINSAIIMAANMLFCLFNIIVLFVDPVQVYAPIIEFLGMISIDGVYIEYQQLISILNIAFFVIYGLFCALSLICFAYYIYKVYKKNNHRPYFFDYAIVFLNILCAVTFLPSLIAVYFVLNAMYAKEKKPDKSNKKVLNQAEKEINNQIKCLKNLKNSGAINQEEYDKLLVEIIK